MSEPTRFRCKIAIMTATDWLNFGAALEKTWPEARYVLDPGQTRTWLTPRLLVSHSFARIYRPAEIRDNPISMILDPAWRPEFYRRDDGRGWWQVSHNDVRLFCCLMRGPATLPDTGPAALRHLRGRRGFPYCLWVRRFRQRHAAGLCLRPRRTDAE